MQHPHLDDIATLLIELYTLLINMQYIPASSLRPPPHTSTPVNTALTHSLNIDTSLIAFLNHIPYIEQEIYDFSLRVAMFGGRFVDYRDDENLRDVRKDPWNLLKDHFANPEEIAGYVPEHIIPLVAPARTTFVEEHTVWLYDVRKGRFGFFTIHFPIHDEYKER